MHVGTGRVVSQFDYDIGPRENVMRQPGQEPRLTGHRGKGDYGVARRRRNRGTWLQLPIALSPHRSRVLLTTQRGTYSGRCNTLLRTHLSSYIGTYTFGEHISPDNVCIIDDSSRAS